MAEPPIEDQEPTSRTMTSSIASIKLREQIMKQIKSNTERAHELRTSTDRELTRLDAEKAELYEVLLSI